MNCYSTQLQCIEWKQLFSGAGRHVQSASSLRDSADSSHHDSALDVGRSAVVHIRACEQPRHSQGPARPDVLYGARFGERARCSQRHHPVLFVPPLQRHIPPHGPLLSAAQTMRQTCPRERAPVHPSPRHATAIDALQNERQFAGRPRLDVYNDDSWRSDEQGVAVYAASRSAPSSQSVGVVIGGISPGRSAAHAHALPVEHVPLATGTSADGRYSRHG